MNYLLKQFYYLTVLISTPDDTYIDCIGINFLLFDLLITKKKNSGNFVKLCES